MSEKTLTVVAIMRAKAGKEQELKTLLEALIEPTHKEAGCLKYEMHGNNADSSEFVFLEEWKSESDLDKHLKTDHLTAAIEKLPELLDGELDLRRLTKIG